MKNGLLAGCFFLVAYLSLLSAKADRFIGGNIQLKPTTGAETYEVSVQLIVDVSADQSVIGSAPCHIYRVKDNLLMTSVYANFAGSKKLFDNSACAGTTPFSSIVWTFSNTVKLPAATYNDPDGYYIIFQQCCRNAGISNIQSPSTTGTAFRLNFKVQATPNSTPEFTAPTPQYVCVNKPFILSFAGKDAENDKLTYELVDPLAGTLTPALNNDFAGIPKASYPSVKWLPGTSASNAIPALQPLQINANNGTLTVTPNKPGMYVFAVRVTETRGNTILSQTWREYQLPVADCQQNKTDKPAVTANGLSLSVVERCDPSPVALSTPNTPGFVYQWQRDGQDIAGATSATLTASDEGIYTVKKSFAYNCGTDETSKDLRVLPPVPPVADILADRTQLTFDGDQIQLRSSPQPDTYKFQWSFDGGATASTSISLVASQPGSYKLRVSTSDDRCPSEDEIDIVRDVRVFMPSAFTPNGDGVNDTWQVLNLSSLTNAEVFVFNRNGGLIYHADKDGLPWDGTYEKQKVPSGVYRYLIRAAGRQLTEGALHVIY